jgi:hypothetical protein
MKRLAAAWLCLAGMAFACVAAEPGHVFYKGGKGPGAGKHVVFLSGDEEYRSEEAMPQLGKIMSQRLGFDSTVLFSVGSDGLINPDEQTSLTHPEALDKADAIVMFLRFRRYPDAVMKRFEAAMNRGVPIIALRTSTHAFAGLPKGSEFEKWNYNNKGGFGRQVLGETWVTHWGVHKKEATRGIAEPSAAGHPILRGVSDVFGDTDVYEAAPPADATIVMRGQVLKGMFPTNEPATYEKKTVKGVTQPVNDPMMPIAWTREHKNDAGTVNRIFCTTMGSSTDFESEGMRRLVVNAVFWGLRMDVPAKANVDIVGEYKPTPYGFKSYKKGIKPGDHALKP